MGAAGPCPGVHVRLTCHGRPGGTPGSAGRRFHIRSIMRDLGLQAAGPWAKVRITVPAQDLDERPDLPGGTPAADEPGRKWCGDIPPQAGGAPSYVRTWAGFIYLATVLDCCTKKAVGYAMADHMHTSLVCQAIDMAVRRCPVEEGMTIFHSDRQGVGKVGSGSWLGDELDGAFGASGQGSGG